MTGALSTEARGDEPKVPSTPQPLTAGGKPAVTIALEPALSSFRIGEAIDIAAYGLRDAAAAQLGVYQVTSQNSERTDLGLHEAGTLEVDDGAAFITLTLDATYQPGEYCLVLQLSPDYQPAAALSALGATRCFGVTK